MNQHLQEILNLIQQSANLSDEEKNALIKSAKNVEKELEVASFKLERTEKVKRTTAILLEETIEELENKRKAVEAQNKELEIESCLERVRTVAMSMNKPDDMLQVCRTISEQLQHLNVKEIRNVQTAIFYKDKGTYMNYEYYAKHNKTFITETSYTDHEIHQDFANKMLKGNGEFMVAHIKGDELKAWVDYQKTTNVFIDDYLYTASSLNYYWFSLGPVALGISTYVPLGEEEINLFKRFLKVFELSYRRYLDIEKAEAQTKEARVQASLERVRASAMAMHKSEDLLDICEVMYKEFLSLGFSDIRNSIINIHDDADRSFINYDYAEAVGKSFHRFTNNVLPFVGKIIKASQNAEDAFSESHIADKALAEFKKLRKKSGQTNDPRLNKAKGLYFYFYSIGTGSIGISTFSPVNEENLKLLKRFRNVFTLCYQRYTDLALAEAQAREAQIEAALERVRAQAMSIRKSEELANVGEIIFEQLKWLGFSDLRNTEIIINNDAKESILSYYYSDYGITGTIEVFYKTNPTVQHWVNELKKASDAFAAIEISEKEIDAWRKYREEIGYQPDPKLDQAKTVFYYSYSTGLGALSISSFTKISDEQIKTLERFRNVFGLAYRRYADVANAEAQAREAQIELALERVRARTMAMQKSEELAGIASVLFKQLLDLGIKSTQMRTCAITTLKADEPIGECWITKPDGDVIPQSFMVPYDETSAYKTIYAAWKNGEKFLVVNLSGDALLQHLNFLKKYASIPTQQFQALPDQPGETFTHAMFFSQGYLFIISNEPLPEYHDIFKRFGAVFQQTYTRFLDLKKAEDQARESQIQLALERVRARTMAMQKSAELSETVFILFQQFKQLGENPDQATIGIINEDERVIEYWVTMYGNQTNRVYKFPIDEPNVTNRIYKAWKEQKKSLVIELTGKELFDFANFRESMGGAAYNPEEKKRVINVAFFSKGIINVQSNESRSEESIRLLERFAAVFEQTYTRFLDLQKAEAQAREAQIEAALERVRSRSMAMQKSEELKEVIQLVYEQFVHLNINIDHAGFVVDYAPKGDWHYWIADKQEIPSKIIVPYFDSLWSDQFNEAKENGIDFFATYWNYEEKNKFYEKLLNLVPELSEEVKQFYFSVPGLAASTVLMDDVSLYIENFAGIPYSGEENKILMRFGKVFQQTYTRFLDLKKAEAQARESQIEAALEKVRSRSLAMHHSDELEQVVGSLFDRLVELGLSLNGALIFIFEKENRNIRLWIATDHLSAPVKIDLPYDEEINNNAIIKDLWSAVENGEHIFNKSYSGKIKNDYFRYVAKYNESKIPLSVRNIQIESDSWTVYFVAEKNSILGFDSWSGHIAKDEDLQILTRFARVFEQAYTRFLDLQKAEAQAREAQIELSLERVRAKTMAMHNSQHVAETVASLFDELVKLGIDKATRSGIAIIGDKKDMEIWTASSGANGQIGMDIGRIDLMIHPMTMGFYQSWKNKEANYTYEFLGEDLKEYFKAVNQSPDYPVQFDLATLPSKLIHSSFFFPEGALYAFSPEPLTTEASKIFKRFAGVFAQTYRRFLDLQKAEAQTRESQIQLALERVRARTMAMQHSQELLEVIKVVSQQLQQLAFRFNHVSFGINNQAQDFHFWTSMANTSEPQELNVPYINNPVFENIRKAQKEQIAFFTDILTPEENNQWTQHMLQCMGEDFLSEDAKSYILDKSISRSVSISPNIFLIIAKYKPIPFSEEENDILKRFGQVFDQSYTRFLDLQKAEAQTRESQIQLALERVRARTMAMQKSEELNDVIKLTYEQLVHLGIEMASAGFMMDYKKTNDFNVWVCRKGLEYSSLIHIPYFDHPIFNLFIEAKEKNLDFYAVQLSKEEKDALYRHGFKYIPGWTEEGKEFVYSLPGYADSHVLTQNVVLYIQNFTGIPYSEEENAVLIRFGKTFEQTYTRFLDLQKAEAQAREAQIEAALEKIRSRSLAMHKSDEMDAVMEELLQRVKELEIDFDAAFILEFKNDAFDMWSGYEPGTISLTKFSSFDIDINYFKDISRAKKGGEELFTHQYSFEEKNKFFSYLFENTNFKEVPEDRKQYLFETKYYTVSIAFAKHTAIQLHSYSRIAFSESENEILKRFVKVFEQAYVRFLDLQKAEAQAKESQIEASLERVRSHAMAMHNSSDLAASANLVFVELKKLGVQQIRSGVGLIDRQTRNMQVYSATSSGDGSLALMGELNLSGHAIFEKQFESWLNHENYFASLKGDELDAYYKIVSIGLGVPLNKVSDENEEYGHWIMFSEGFLYAWSHQKYSDEEIKILERFKNVIELTFRRYDDLQKAEASAKEAIKQSALDRIRADIASMRTTNDLERITPLIWNELTVLGIPFIRCGVFIMDEEQQQVQTFLYTEGKTIASFTSTFSNSKIISEALPFWRRKEIFKTHWDETAFLEQAKSLVEQGSITTGEKYLTEHRPTDLYLHFLPFLQGMLYVGDAAPLSDDHLQLMQALAEAFSTAYARYEDFNKLEVAKQQVDKALSDLKQTQTQLIQSEKMASLGELTAGIAHEIQNPLNFVNNFSEVNVELIGELVAEVDKGNTDEVKAIANDIRENSEKINHHGKRADGIVKGMLQHSRSSSGQKEPTDINVLTDEYLRLCYHGLRAKDKSFNATIKTDFDNTIGKINIIPQDIGRVILNLLTNAFYAVNEKKQLNIEGYSPTVSVNTKQSGNQVSIIVSDNGNGIPQKIVDKIFQPFFTTKPTGQGTGLGLSLSYDIIKAHGGEIKVETKEGEGSEFVIQLPVV